MVLKKRLDYGFSGYQFPSIPRAPRSLRRVSHKKSVEDSQICAFELLAAVAGKLLQESESSTSSNAAEGRKLLKDDIKKEPIECKASRSDCIDQGSCIESVFVPEVPQHNVKTHLKESPPVESDYVMDHTPKVAGSDFSEKVACKQNAIANIPNKPKEGEIQLKPTAKHSGDLIVDNICGSKDPIELCINTNILTNSDSSVQLPLYTDSVPNDSFPKHRDDVKIGSRDEEEKLFGCNQLCTKRRDFRPKAHIGYRRIRKILTSRYWDVAPKLKDCEPSNTGMGMKGFYRNRKAINKREGCEPEAPSKRRKLFDRSSTAVYDQEASSESISISPEKGVKADKGCSTAILHGSTGITSSVIGHKIHFGSKDPRVKFSIKSFRIPELYIEVPETTTVGSLKRTVMDAVTAILGGELHVGVLLQGKKVRDDNRTLLQTGTSCSDDLDTLGFSLEPSFPQASSLPSPKDPPSLLTHQQLSKSSTSPILDSGVSKMTCDPPLVTNLDNHNEHKHEIFSFPIDAYKDLTKSTVSKALVPVTAINAEALAVVPLNQKTKRSELSRRRTRRPFSVPEVEALVEAVEKLGTGRWRDVKIRAFSEANHRTYVDLKDKWKTLVHTASIAPQQRRGEPVPQELLDRVLAAHGYWSRHQSLQHGKHQAEPLKLCGEIGV